MLPHNSGSARLPGLTKSLPDTSRQLPCPAQVHETPNDPKTSIIHNFVHITPFWTRIGPLESTCKALHDRTIYKQYPDSPIFTTYLPTIQKCLSSDIPRLKLTKQILRITQITLPKPLVMIRIKSNPAHQILHFTPTLSTGNNWLNFILLISLNFNRFR